MTARADRTGPRITALAGGIGAARFLRGVRAALAGTDATVTVVGNTADDITLHGLHVSPDLDTVMYTLGGGIHPEQGWGRAEETFSIREELAAYEVEPSWFTLGDRDLATHIIRTQMLAAGYSLTQVTQALCHRWLGGLVDPPVVLLPMSEDRIETHVVTDVGAGETAIHFQEWWVRYRAEPAARRIVLVGADRARPGPQVLAAIRDADVVLLPPSNPVVSIGPILSLPGVRDALAQTAAPVVGVSPIIGGAPVSGMAGQCLQAIGVATTADAVAGLYSDVLDGWLVDEVDVDVLPALAALGLRSRAIPLRMTSLDATTAMARAALDLAGQSG